MQAGGQCYVEVKMPLVCRLLDGRRTPDESLDGERPRPHRGRGAQHFPSPFGERQTDVLAHGQGGRGCGGPSLHCQVFCQLLA